MPYKISGTKSETARVTIFKESDWSIESNTVISGSGAYEVGNLETGNKTVFGRSNDGEVLSYGNVSPVEYVIPEYYPFDEVNQTADDVEIEPGGLLMGPSNTKNGPLGEAEVEIYDGGGATITRPAGHYYLRAYNRHNTSESRYVYFHFDTKPRTVTGVYCNVYNIGNAWLETGGHRRLEDPFQTWIYYPMDPAVVTDKIHFEIITLGGSGLVYFGIGCMPVTLD